MALKNMHEFIENILRDWHAPGAAVAVLKGDDVLMMHGLGYRDVERELPVTPDTRFAIASCTKAFTAMGVALLVDDGLLEWDTPVRDYLPEFRMYDNYATQNLTVRDLLCHRSGIPRHDYAWVGTDFTREEIVHNLRYLKPFTSFREKYYYQNIMYATVGYLCQVVSGQVWEDFIAEQIFDVLGMEKTNFSYIPDDPTHDTALPYHFDVVQQKLVRLRHYAYRDGKEYEPTGPAGSIYSTITDLAKWLQVHLRSSEVPLVSESNLRQMHLPHTIIRAIEAKDMLYGTDLLTYGLGWRIRPHRGYTLIQHGGAMDGFRSTVSFVPEAQIGVVVLTNLQLRDTPDAITLELIDEILELDPNHWHQQLLEISDVGNQAMLAAEMDSVSGQPPTHDPDTYTGTYGAPGYPDFEVKFEDGQLLGLMGGEWWFLKHLNHDNFRLRIAKWRLFMDVRFFTSPNGLVDEVAVGIEPMVEDVVFTREALKVSHEVLDGIVGTYDLPFEGLDVVISIRNGTLAHTATGQPTGEVILKQFTSNTLITQDKEDERQFIEFWLDGSKMVITEPGIRVEAPRKS
jgi:CubicO group peptidase (beta-lactamase class C family)